MLGQAKRSHVGCSLIHRVASVPSKHLYTTQRPRGPDLDKRHGKVNSRACLGLGVDGGGTAVTVARLLSVCERPQHRDHHLNSVDAGLVGPYVATGVGQIKLKLGTPVAERVDGSLITAHIGGKRPRHAGLQRTRVAAARRSADLRSARLGWHRARAA